MTGDRDPRAIQKNAAAAGLRIELPPDDDCEVWPENWPVMGVAVRMMSQLNEGFSGVIGMRFEALPVIVDALEIPQTDHLDVIDGLRVVEREVVRLLRERR